MRDRGPVFDAAVPRNGYAWWYVDAISDDRTHGLTVIAFIGSVFSPYYAASRRRGDGDPLDHCAINIALYGPRGKYWALTERRASSLVRSKDTLSIGPSALHWDGTSLIIDIDELAVPRFVRLKGRVRIRPQEVTSSDNPLDAQGHHSWWPIAPSATVEIEMLQPSLRWRGSGYLDCNWGARPLEQDFTGWNWSRTELPGGAAILYDAQRRDGSRLSLAHRFDRTGRRDIFEPPPTVTLPRTGWRIPREARSEGTAAAHVIKTLEDTPFYARSMVATRLLGQPTVSMHESLSLDRFASRWVQTLLPFRMPRAFR